MKTIDINSKSWWDKVNGNTYFAGIITIDYGMETEQTFKMPYQYGYGSQHEHEVFRVLQEAGLIPKDAGVLFRYCKDNNIILRTSMKEKCLKRELKNI